MPSVLAPAEVRVSASTLTASGLLWRIGGFLLSLAVEVILISSQAQHVAFSEAHGLAGLLFTLGTWKIRVPITLAVIFLLFWQAKGRQNARRISQDMLRGVIFSKVGDAYNEDAVRRDVMLLRNMISYSFDDVRVSTEEGKKGGVILRFIVAERPTIR